MGCPGSERLGSDSAATRDSESASRSLERPRLAGPGAPGRDRLCPVALPARLGPRIRPHQAAAEPEPPTRPGPARPNARLRTRPGPGNQAPMRGPGTGRDPALPARPGPSRRGAGRPADGIRRVTRKRCAGSTAPRCSEHDSLQASPSLSHRLAVSRVAMVRRNAQRAGATESQRLSSWVRRPRRVRVIRSWTLLESTWRRF